ncbi:MAG: hypothetical protein EBR95_05365 [Verrucomicrobia bacterium]|nr:hypothetical protein [Verrucomicrobiota bacterium]
MRPLFRPTSALLMAAIWGGLPAFALDLEGLAKNSPFGGTGAAAGPGAAPSTLEFRGMYAEGGVNYYSIYNTETKQSSWVAEGEAPSTNVPVVIKGYDAANETLNVDNGGQPQQMALHQAVVVTYKGPSPAQLAAVSAAVAPQASAGGAVAGMPQNLTPEQVEAFRQQMRERFGKRGAEPTTSTKTPKNAAPAPTTTKPPKAPKVR